MKPSKDIILSLLKTIYLENGKNDIVSNKSITNVIVFENEVIIDLEINNPTLQSKNKIKASINDVLKSKFNQIDVKVRASQTTRKTKCILGMLELMRILWKRELVKAHVKSFTTSRVYRIYLNYAFHMLKYSMDPFFIINHCHKYIYRYC